jgi:uncharacterized membrane protein
VLIRQPIEAVFAYAADYRNDPEWRAEVTDMRYATDDPVGVGTQTVETIALWGRHSVTQSRITVYEPNRRVDFEYVSGPLPVSGSRSFEAVDGGTRVTCTLEGHPTGRLERLFSPVSAFVYRRRFDGYLLRLKAILEVSRAPAA